MSWLRDFTTYQGRLNRLQLLWRHAAICFVGAAGGMLLIFAVSTLMPVGGAFTLVMSAIMIPLMYAELSLVVRRFHDVGLSGWWLLPIFAVAGVLFLLMEVWPSPWLLLALFPVNFGYIFLLFLVPGSRETNRFGEPPTLP